MLWQILGYATLLSGLVASGGVTYWLKSTWTPVYRRPVRVPKRLDDLPITLDSDWIGFL